MPSFTILVVILTTFYSVSAFTLASNRSHLSAGASAWPGQFPYQVSLHHKSWDVHICSGSIIRHNWIITAAHCVEEELPSDISIVVGAHFRDNDGTPYEVAEIVIHEQFDNSGYVSTYDIALVRSLNTIAYNSKVSPISIGDGTFYGAGVLARSSRWFLGHSPDDLRYINMVTLSNRVCEARLEKSTESIYDGLICAYSYYHNRETCNGDTGGPLVSGDTLIGIVSWGDLCTIGRPHGFTRVSYFLPWILSHVDRDSSNTTNIPVTLISFV